MSVVSISIANHCAIVSVLCIANLLSRSIFSTAGSFGQRSKSYSINWGCRKAQILVQISTILGGDAHDPKGF